MSLTHSSQTRSALVAEEDKLLACVHCGLCLEACPTYVVTGDENDGPRGRIYLMRAVEEDRLPPTSNSFATHINRCLGCRACEAVCPAGVQYGQLLEAARADLHHAKGPRSFAGRALDFALRHIWTHPKRLRAAFNLARILRDSRLPSALIESQLLARVLPRKLQFALALLASSASVNLNNENQAARKQPKTSIERSRIEVKEETKREALLFTGCAMEGLFARVNRATTRVLKANSCKVGAPAKQVCCGALHAHAGDLEGARALARRNLEAFTDERGTPVVTNAGGCGAMLISYERLLEDDSEYAVRAREFSARVLDVSQQFETIGLRPGARLEMPFTTYDASCHLMYGQHANDAMLRVLKAIPDLKLVSLNGSEMCCGGAGVYNLLQTEMSARVLAEKLAHIEETGAQILATANPGCHMQIGAGAHLKGMNLRVCHPVELLDESYRRAGFYRSGIEGEHATDES